MPDYSQRFSRDVNNFFRSPVREIFKRVDLSKIYSFAGGYPSHLTFPMDKIAPTVDTVIARYGSRALQYGATQGTPELREAIAARCGVGLERVQITTSSQQGIDVTTRVLVNPGDVVLTSAPTYLGALQSFRSYRATVVGIPHCDNLAAWTDSWQATIHSLNAQGKTLKMIYMIPDFQNPSGETLTLAERQALVDVANEHDLIILEDSPYRELRYEGSSVPTLYSLAPDRVIHLGSFSKIIAPGLRVGWMIAHPGLLDAVYVCKQSLDLCAPLLDQYLACEFLTSGLLDDNLSHTIALYRRKRDLMLSLLSRYMPQGVSWTRPEGGLFLFVTLPPQIDTVALYDAALARGVAYVAGSFFYPDGTGRNTMRLNFSFLDEEKMPEGIRLLVQIIAQAM